ncbi:MAG: amino acid permease [Pseudomonadota bacterium]|nr:amino acid permease [Pyrinomonadaceae bacterium]MBA3558624.1 amino acid permease [Gemmatimonadaceae bacterium]MDQ3580273.1 amino acid permease [Pseudomonadota bacterium]
MVSEKPSHQTATLERTLGLRDLILLIIGAVIGSGIFIVPSAVLRQVQGSVALAMLVWLAGGVLSLLGALTYGELAARNAKAGGIYIYIRDCFGPLPAFLYGWTLFLVISSGAIAALAVAFSAYLGEIVPLTPALSKLVAVGMIAIVTVVNVRGTRESANVQNWTTAIKITAILIMSAGLLWLGRGFSGAGVTSWPTEAGASLASGFGLAMIAVLWAYEGWQYVTFSAGETLNAQRNFPRALLIGSAALIGIYLLANLAYIAALGPTKAAQTDSIAATAVTAVAGPAASKLVALAILISIFGAANGVTLTAPRVYYAMARDGLFFHRLAEVHPGFRTPAFAVLASSAWAAVLAATGTFEQLLTFVVFSGWLFYALGAACIFIYRRRGFEVTGLYRVPGYPWTPLLFILAAAALVINTMATQPGRAAVGLGVVLLGAPVYFIWRWRKGVSGSETNE